MIIPFVFRCLNSIISSVSIGYISRLYLLTVAEQVDLFLTSKGAPMTQKKR